MEKQKEILTALGSNPIIKAGKIVILAEDWFQKIEDGYPSLEAEYLRLEPEKDRMVKTKTEAFASVRTRWLPTLDEFRTIDWSKLMDEILQVSLFQSA